MAEETQGKKGIEVSKDFLRFLIQFFGKVYQIVKDKKVTFAEGVSIAMDIPEIWAQIKEFDEIIAEMKDIDPAEASELLGVAISEVEVLVNSLKAVE